MNYDAVYSKIESIGGKYFSLYMHWLTEKLAGQSAFGMLTLATSFVIFLLALYIWLRMKD